MFLSLGQGVATASSGFHTVQAGGPPAPAPRVVQQAAPRVVVPQVRRERVVVHRVHRHHEQPVHVWFRKYNRNDNNNIIHPAHNTNTNFNRQERGRERDRREDGGVTFVEPRED